jgi:hypothetical protein
MKVVVHDHPSMDGHIEGLRLLLPQRQQALAIGIVTHNDLPVIAALDHMMWVGGNSEAGLTRHSEKRKWKASV